ncbi:MAG TPA: ABC transporter permease [Thermodesulfatator sp.]|nr:ABC transporter permease [Thermodesulfatator sp.]
MEWRRIRALVVKESIEIRKDPLFMTMAFLVPSILMILFGYGLSLDVENIPLAIVDQDGSDSSRDYLYHFIQSRYFSLKGSYHKEDEALERLVEGKIRVVIIVPPGFERDLHQGRAAYVQTIVDGIFPYRAQMIKGYLAAINGTINRQRLRDHLARKSGLPLERAETLVNPVRLEVRYLFNQEVKSIHSIAPALIGMVLLMTPPLLTAVAIVREKETGSIFNIYSSTISRLEFVIGKLLPYFVISCFNALVLWLLAIYVFKAPFRGSFSFFYLSAVAYVAGSTGLGLLISTFARSQIAAIMVAMVATMIPSFLYSGMLVPVSCLDRAGQIEARLFPSMYFTAILHGTFLKASRWQTFGPEIAFIVFYALLMLFLGYKLFRKRVKR